MTGRELHWAIRNWRKLVDRYQPVLSHIMDDPDHWQHGVPQIISLLNKAVHQGNALPRSLFDVPGYYLGEKIQDYRALATEWPRLKPWLAALSWFSYLYPPETAAALDWTRQYAAELDTIMSFNDELDGIILIQGLWSLTSRNGPDLVSPMLRLLGNPQLYTVPIVEPHEARTYSNVWTSFLKTAQPGAEKLKFPERPEGGLNSSLIAFFAWLVGQPQQVRKNALTLFNLVWSDDLFARWSDWWTVTDRQVLQAKQLFHLKNSMVIEAGEKKVRNALHKGRGRLPPPIYLEFTLSQIRLTAKEYVWCRELFQILPIVPRLGNGALMRAAFFAYWAQLQNHYPGKLPVLLRYLRQSWQNLGIRGGMFELWRRVIIDWQGGRYYRVWHELIEEKILRQVKEQHLWPIICDTVTACAGTTLTIPDGDHEDDETDDRATISGSTLVRIATLTGDLSQSKLLISSLSAQPLKSSYLPEAILEFAFHLERDPKIFAGLVARLQTIPQEDGWFIPALKLAADRLENSGWQGLAADLILRGEQKRLAEIGQRLHLLSKFGLNVSPPAALPPDMETPDWARSYPGRFHPALRLLVSLNPRAQRQASNILSENFRDADQMQREIGVLREKLAEDPAQTGLAKRLANLEKRLISPKPVSEERLARLEEKLVGLVSQQALVKWEERIESTLRQALKAELQVEDVPDWMLASQQIRVFGGLLTLSLRYRQLGLRLMQRRCGPPPWSLSDEPANRGFIAAMEKRGVKMESWLEPPLTQKRIGSNGREVQLSFESDPLEIFLMGNHFNTCLSVGDINFFSVLANAADINKHVVYARDEGGQVVGRCLLALTNEGSLLTFEPYCHDPELGFKEMMAGVVSELAEQMQAPIHLTGTVPALVAPSWYDDGPRDLTGRFEFLEEGSDFRQALPDMTPEAFLEEVQARFDPLPLNALTLTLILELPELNQNPDLFRPLLPFVEAEKAIPDHTMRRVVKLAYDAGEMNFVRQAMDNWARTYVQRTNRRLYYQDRDVVLILAEFEPSLALRFLRSNRPPGVRQDEEETGWRRAALAIAHQNLGRFQLAQRLRAGSQP